MRTFIIKLLSQEWNSLCRIPLILLSFCILLSCEADDIISEPEPIYDFVVAQDGTGDFTSVQEAFDAIKFLEEKRTLIFIKKGTYKEVLTLPKAKNNVTIIGEDADEVILTYDNYASKINPENGEEYGTSGSSSTYIYGDNFYACNVTFENSSGPVGQALAIYIGGDKAVFTNCRFVGWQDTMYGGRGRQYFKDCYIEGSTDFIFGPSTAFFENCDLYTKGGSAITAASTEDYVTYGYVFKNCTITGSGSNITTLGRPWRLYAAVAFIKTEMSDAIKPEGWNNWGNPDNELTARYAEYSNSGEGAKTSQRVDWVEFLTPAESLDYTPANVLKTTYSNPPVTDNWNPAVVIEATDELLME
jgi:pectinesterase